MWDRQAEYELCSLSEIESHWLAVGFPAVRLGAALLLVEFAD